VLSCTAAIDLAEALEQMLCLFLVEAAAGIDDLEPDVHLILCKLSAVCVVSAASNENFASLRKLDCVADDIEQDLSNPETVAFDLRWNIVFNQIIQFDAFVDGHGRG
jgi:hypothetical protein